MARQARQISPTGYYHVMMRGINREKIFKNKQQKSYFVKLLKIIATKEPVDVTAYCLMDNHVHIVLKGELVDLSLAIKKLNIKYAMWFNKSLGRVGHVFQGRFKSEIVTDDKYLMMVIRYVHNNPVKAKLVTCPEEYKWSSYGEYANNKPNVIGKEQVDFVMEYFSGKVGLFKEFHFEEDLTEFLDIREEIEANRMDTANKIVSNYCSNKGLNIKGHLHKKPEIINELIKILLEKSKLSHRKIADLLNINSNVVHKVSLKRKTSEE